MLRRRCSSPETLARRHCLPWSMWEALLLRHLIPFTSQREEVAFAHLCSVVTMVFSGGVVIRMKEVIARERRRNLLGIRCCGCRAPRGRGWLHADWPPPCSRDPHFRGSGSFQYARKEEKRLKQSSYCRRHNVA